MSGTVVPLRKPEASTERFRRGEIVRRDGIEYELVTASEIQSLEWKRGREVTGKTDKSVLDLLRNAGATKVTGNATVGGRPDLSGLVTGDVQGELLRLQAGTATSSTLRVQGDTITGQSSLWGPVTLRRSQ